MSLRSLSVWLLPAVSSEVATKTLVQAFTSCCLNYYDMLLYVIMDNLFQHLIGTNLSHSVAFVLAASEKMGRL